MKKEDFKVGQLVYFGDTTSHTSKFGGKASRGVIIKLNPKRAKVKSIDPAGKWPAGCVWTCHYSRLVPVVGSDESINEMTMRSFEKPDDYAVKAWSAAQKNKTSLPETLSAEDEFVMRAVCEIYGKIDDVENKVRYELSSKLALLFRVLGSEVLKSDAEAWLLERTSPAGA